MLIRTQKQEQPQMRQTQPCSFIEYLLEEIFGYAKLGIDFIKELHKPDDKKLAHKIKQVQ